MVLRLAIECSQPAVLWMEPEALRILRLRPEPNRLRQVGWRVTPTRHSSVRPPDAATAQSRRDCLRAAAALALGTALGVRAQSALGAKSPATASGPLTRPIPSSGEALPLVGLGTWITFNVGNDPKAQANVDAVVQAFFAAGGRVIDSSPMYGSSQPAVGRALKAAGMPKALFAAEKVWTSGAGDGAAQMAQSRDYWGVPRFDLMQVHNLVDWETQLPQLRRMKAEGQLRYVGITTSHGRRHGDVAELLQREKLDFVQLTYNPLDRDAEQRLLPLAQDRGVAVLVNRPFQGGRLAQRLASVPLPGWAAEIGCRSWAQVVLKFVISHPAVTTAIPATTQVAHVRENLAAASGPMPDAALRQRIVQAIEAV